MRRSLAWPFNFRYRPAPMIIAALFCIVVFSLAWRLVARPRVSLKFTPSRRTLRRPPVRSSTAKYWNWDG